MEDLIKLSDYEFFTAKYTWRYIRQLREYNREEFRREKVLSDKERYYIQCLFGEIKSNLTAKEIHHELYKVQLQKERFSRSRKQARLENEAVDYQVLEGTCEYCGKKFRTNLTRKYYTSSRCMRFCCVDCRLAYYKAEGKKKRAEKRGKTCCEVCGREFIPRRKGALYCSNKCRQKAYRERKSTIGNN